MQPKLHDPAFAKHARSHCLAPGLFRAARKGDEQRNLNVYHFFNRTNDDETLPKSRRHWVRFIGFRPLCARELKVLAAIVGLAGRRNVSEQVVPGARNTSELGRSLLAQLKDRGPGRPVGHVARPVVRVETTYEELGRLVGYAKRGSSMRKNLDEALLRLSSVSIHVHAPGERLEQTWLLSRCVDLAQGRVHIALNAEIARAVFSKDNFTMLKLDDLRGLRQDAAVLTYQRLCGFLNHGARRTLAVETLIGYIWPEPTNEKETLKKRRQRLKRALGELTSIGWDVRPTVLADGSPAYELRRPRISREELAQDDRRARLACAA